VDRKHQKHLDALRRGHAETAEHIATSQRAVEDSLALLRRIDTTEAEQKPETHSAGQGPDRTAREKTRPSRSGT
jgi:hypothetical protein